MANATTFLDALYEKLLAAAEYNPANMVAPAAILWPDEKREWEALVPVLRELHPAFLTLGEYHPEEQTGPAIYLKCLLGGKYQAESWPEGVTPVIYLPGYARRDLRAVESCPKALKPLAELQYRGVIWSQVSHRDWTVFAFLKSKDALGLDAAQDKATLEAMSLALLALADTKVADLRGRKLEAEDFHKLLSQDPPKDVLRWMNSAEGIRKSWPQEKWKAFCAVCKSTYGFDPVSDGELVAAEKLAKNDDQWSLIWERFCEAPSSYPGVVSLLERAHPSGQMLFDDEKAAWPRANDEDEEKLRSALLALDGQPSDKAMEEIHKLEGEHGLRREWVWAKLGRSPLAIALRDLATLAAHCKHHLPCESVATMTEAYTQEGWKADDAALKALAGVDRAEDVKAVTAAVNAVYRPWLEQNAELLQGLVKAGSYPGHTEDAIKPVQAGTGECLLFADGLRYDIAQRLLAALADEEWEVNCTYRWTALPSVTATCKPAVSPVADKIIGDEDGTDFRPQVEESGKLLDQSKLRRLLEDAEYQHQGLELSAQSGKKGWSEFGDLDKRGHDEGWKLAKRIDEQVKELVERIRTLSLAGWENITVVTDHGWLLLPGGLPKVELPHYLADTRWGRCAALKETASGVEQLVVDWRWSASVRIALAPGIGAFKAGIEYTHGGLSLQECVTPVLTLRMAGTTEPVEIVEITWKGLACSVKIQGPSGLLADIRQKPNDPRSSTIQDGKPKTLKQDGSVRLLIDADKDHMEGHAATVVILDTTGKVLKKEHTTIGGD